MESLGRAYRPRDFGTTPVFDLDTELLHYEDEFPELRELEDEQRIDLMATRWAAGLDIYSGKPLIGRDKADWEVCQVELHGIMPFFRRFQLQSRHFENRVAKEGRGLREPPPELLLGQKSTKRKSGRSSQVFVTS